MRRLTAPGAGLIASALLLLGCSADQSAPTAPTAPSLGQAGVTIDPTHTYEFSARCGSRPSTATVALLDGLGELGDVLQMNCLSRVKITPQDATNITGFEASVWDASETEVCHVGPESVTGTFRCPHYMTITVKDLGV